MGRPEVLQSGPVTLRRWSPDRIEQLDAAINASLPELKLFMPWATDAHNLDDTRGYVERCGAEWDAGQAWDYAILLADEVIGSCGLMTRAGPGALEIGYWVHSARTGHGYATAAAKAVAEQGLLVPGVERLVIKHDQANTASGRVAAKIGFTRVDEESFEPQTPGQSGVMVTWELRG